MIRPWCGRNGQKLKEKTKKQKSKKAGQRLKLSSAIKVRCG
jgi:hypothetical protein